MSNYFVKFVKFIKFEENIGYCQVMDSGSLRSAILLCQDGFFSIPQENSLVQVIKSKDSEQLYIIGSITNTNLINIDNDKKEIMLSNVENFNIVVNGDINITCKNATIEADGDVNTTCKNATIKADALNLGDEGGGLVLTENDKFTIPVGGINVGVQAPTGLNTNIVEVVKQTVTTITKAK